MITRTSRRPAPGAAPRLAAVLLGALLAVAACAGGASPSPSGPSPTGSLAPAMTATPAPTAAPSATPTPVPTPVAAATYPLTLTDDEGTAVRLPARPERIVSLTPATTEILFALGAGDRVVGNTDFDDYPPAVKGLPHVASFQGVDVEKIVGLGADLVVAGGNGFNAPESLKQLRDLGIPVLVVYAPDVAGVLRDIELVGTAAGEGPAASAMATGMRTEIDAIVAALAGSAAARPRVFYETGDQPAIYGTADDSFLAEMVRLAGGSPVTTGSATNWEMPVERLVSADPQVIVLGDAPDVTAGQVAARAGWEVSRP